MRKARNPKRAIVFWAAAAAWAALIFFFSTQNADDSGSLSLMISTFLLKYFPFLASDPNLLNGVLRKIAHFGIFAVEGFLIAMASADTFSPRSAYTLTTLFCAAMAALNEYSQTFAAGRSCELRDMLIDFGGAILGICAAAALRALLNRKKNASLQKLTF